LLLRLRLRPLSCLSCHSRLLQAHRQLYPHLLALLLLLLLHLNLQLHRLRLQLLCLLLHLPLH
jgi:hypothetical protein